MGVLEVIIAVIGFFVTILVASTQYSAAKDRETQARLFQHKQEVYVKIVRMIMQLIYQKGDASEGNIEKITQDFRDIKTNLIIWGSFKTIETLNKVTEFQTQGGNPDSDGVEVTLWFKELFGHIRKDLGHNDTDVEILEIALSNLNEPDKTRVKNQINSMSQTTNAEHTS